MCSLVEFQNVSQVPGEPRRRWFTSDDLDLVVWCDDSGAAAAFQLCYNKARSECALTWTPDRGFSHRAVDTGEYSFGKYKAAPILGADVPVWATLIRESFARVSTGLPVEFANFVSNKLRELPNDVTQA
ncbi:MAG TPA: hypothetical protein VL361_20920 [Candidatus Limnocylindrales bacterium]|jgi:hypothetical protein|nr:hypothetical protein [Candidatus Limnocylindrales bacterium]